MAAPTTELGNTYVLLEATREDLLDIITNISPTDTPFFSSVAKGSCSATLHEWLTDALAAAAANAHIEGGTPTYPALPVRTRLTNYTQILTNPFQVSRTQERTLKAGIQSEVAYQATKKLEEHKLDFEWAIFNNADAGAAGGETSGIPDTARQLKKIDAFITTKDTTAGIELTESVFNDGLESAWNAGGRVDTCMTTAKLKRRITLYTANVQRTLELMQNAERRQINRVDIYEGDFGVVRIVPNRTIPINATPTPDQAPCYLLEMDRFRIDFLTPPLIEELARDGDAVRRWVYSEGTLVGLAPGAHYVWTKAENLAAATP